LGGGGLQALARGFLSRQKTHALTTAELVFINMVPPAPVTTIDPQSRCVQLWRLSRVAQSTEHNPRAEKCQENGWRLRPTGAILWDAGAILWDAGAIRGAL